MHLRVKMPSVPARRGPAQRDAKIGRKIAALFGIAGDPSDVDAGAGRHWHTSYSAATQLELSLGGPQRFKDLDVASSVDDLGVCEPTAKGRPKRAPAGEADRQRGLGTVDESRISATILRDFGPDPKSAFVLTGANEVLRPLTEAISLVTTSIKFADTRLLLGTVAMLLSEAYRSQPLLIQAGVQAQQIQNVLLHERRASILADPPSESEPWRTSRIDMEWISYESQFALKKAVCPDELNLIADTWRRLMSADSVCTIQVASPLSPRFGQKTDTSQISYLAEHAHARLCSTTQEVLFGFLSAVGGTRIVARRKGDSSFYVDFPGVATRPARLFVDSVIGAGQIEATEYFPIAPGALPVPMFDADRWMNEPSAIVQRVALWLHHCAERFVVSGAWSESEPHASSFASRVQQRELLASTSEKVFGRSDPMTVQLRIYATSYSMEQARRTHANAPNAEMSEELEAHVQKFEQQLEELVGLHVDGKVFDSHLVETLHPTLMDLRLILDVAGTTRLRKRVSSILESMWCHYVRVQLSLLAPPSHVPQNASQTLADLGGPEAPRDPILQAVLESSPGLAIGVSGFSWRSSADLALSIQRNTVARRRDIYSLERDWAPFRQALVDEAQLTLNLLIKDTGGSAFRRIDLAHRLHQILEGMLTDDLKITKLGALSRLRGLSGLNLTLAHIAEYMRLTTIDPASRETGGLAKDLTTMMQGAKSAITLVLSRGQWSNRDDLRTYRLFILKLLEGQDG